MRPSVEFRIRADPPAGAVKLTFGRKQLYIRGELAPFAEAIIARLGDWHSRPGPGLGNRRSGFRLSLAGGPELFARHSRRGGLMRLLLSDLFVGFDPRPLRELQVASEAYRRGLPVAEPAGAMVEWLAPAVYRGFFLTRAMSGMSLWEQIRTDDDPVVRRHVLEQTRRAIETMHRGGLFHADLNLHNLLVTKNGESFAVIILDLDKARLFNRPLGTALRRRNAARLLRSVRKLDPHGRFFDSATLALFDVN